MPMARDHNADIKVILEDKYSQMILHKAKLTGYNLASLGMQEDYKGNLQYITSVTNLYDKPATDAGKKVQVPVARAKQFDATKWLKGAGFERRVLSTDIFNLPVPVAEIDNIEALSAVSIQNETVRLIANQFALGRDRAVIEALTGSAYVLQGTHYGTGTAVGLPADHTIGDHTTKPDIEVLTEVIRIFRSKHLGSEPITMLVNEWFEKELIKIQQVTSFDYNNVKPLTNGRVYRFLGINFIPISSELTGGDGTTGKEWKAIAMAGKPFKFAQKLKKMEISKLPEHNYDWSVFAEEAFGATRTEEERVIILKHGKGASK